LIDLIILGVIIFYFGVMRPFNQSNVNIEGVYLEHAKNIPDLNLIDHHGNLFTNASLTGHWTLMFFGFTHCASICPTTLDMLKRAYTELRPIHPDLQVVLISLDPERDNDAALANYMHGFNPDFIGVTGNVSDLRKLQSQFGIYAARDGATADNYQLQHTASIMLVNPKGEWAGLFRYGLSPVKFIQAFKLATIKN
jgi:protein SCO1/2